LKHIKILRRNTRIVVKRWMFRIKLAPTIELKVEYDWIQSENIIL